MSERQPSETELRVAAVIYRHAYRPDKTMETAMAFLTKTSHWTTTRDLFSLTRKVLDEVEAINQSGAAK